MAKLSETFKLGGGESTAPVSNNQLRKLSQTFTVNNGSSAISAANQQEPSNTFAIGQSLPMQTNSEIPKVEEPSFDYRAVINKYETLPDTNLFSRIFSKDSRDAYKLKQKLSSQYEEAKDYQTKKKLDALGITDDDVAAEMVDPNPRSALTNLFKSKGVTNDTEIKALVKAAENRVDRITKAKTKENMEKWADDNKVLGTLASFPLKVGADVSGIAQNIGSFVTGNPYTNSTGGNWGTQVVQGMRNEISDDFGTAGKLAYDIGTSIGDMAPVIALGGIPGLAYAGTSAAQSSIPSLIERGLSPRQITLTAMANGVAEAALEKLPLGNLEKWAKQPIEKSFKSIAKVIGSQMASEGLEESGTDIANTVFDALINGNQAELKQEIDEKGFAPAMLDYVKQVGYSGLAGALSGGVMGGGAAGVNVVRNGFYNSNNEIPEIKQAENAQTEIPAANEPSASVVSAITGGKATVIQSPYQGQKPMQDTAERKRISIPPEDMDNAITNLDVSSIDSRLYGRNQRKILTKVYETLFGSDANKTSFDVAVNGTSFDGKPYNVTVNKNAIGKICSDPNMSAEKLAVIDNLNEVIKNAEYINSGNYQNYKKRESDKNVIRYDYFETDAKINGQDYVVTFDVEVIPGHNNYRTHKIINEINLTPVGGEMGPVPTAPEVSGFSNPNISQTNENVNSNAQVKPKEIQKLEAPEPQEIQALEKPKRNKVVYEDIGLNDRTVEDYDDGDETSTDEGESIEIPIEELEDKGNGSVYKAETATNTLRNSEIFNQTEQTREIIENMIKDGTADVERQTWLAAGKEAVKNLEEKGFDGVKEEIMQSDTETTQTQIAESVYIVDNEIQKALKSGDTSEIQRFTRRLVERMHEVGRALQSLRMYGNTSAGMIAATDTIIGDNIKAYMNEADRNKNGKKAKRLKENAILAEALRQIGYDGSMEQDVPDKTYQQILKEVKTTLDNEMSSVNDNMFTDTDAEYLAHMIEKGATVDEIKSALNQHLVTGYFGMTSEDLQAIVDYYNKAENAKSSKDKAEYRKKAAAIASKYLGKPTFMDKWNAWRYLSMLGNPRTMIRNILGNTTFGAVTDVKDAVGALIESAVVKKGNRTKAILNPVSDKALIDACAKDFDEVAYEEATEGGHKYNMKSDVENERQVFKSRLLEKSRTLTNTVLEKSDIAALKLKYKRALAGYLKANGYNADVLKTDNAILDKARAYAINQAKEATFHADNATADLLAKWSHDARQTGGVAGKAASMAIESIVPFKKTPANILKQGFEYSPLGVLKLISQIKNQAGANAIIDSISKELTGSAILAIGAWLTSRGLLVGQRGDEDDPFNKGSDYALQIGDKSYTIDWTAPAALPLFVGSELYRAFNPNESAEESKNFFEALASIAEPAVEMSMLQGLSNTLSSLANVKNAKLGTTMANIGSGYVSQVIPTLAGQVARTIDPYRRTTRTNTSSYTSPITATLEKAGEKVANKIPFLSMANEKYLDVWGNEQQNSGGNILGRAFQNFVSPGYLNDTSLTPREQKLATLDKTYTGQGSLIPALADNNRPGGGRLTNKEYNEWTKVRGKELKDAVDSALGYQNKVPTEDLQAYIHDIELLANVIARHKKFGTDIPKTYKKKYEAYVNGGESYRAVMDYLIRKSK